MNSKKYEEISNYISHNMKLFDVLSKPFMDKIVYKGSFLQKLVHLEMWHLMGLTYDTACGRLSSHLASNFLRATI
jgi:hypothetical protein